MKNWLTTLNKTFAEKSNVAQADKTAVEQAFLQFTQLHSYDAQVIIAVCLFSQRRKRPYISDITSFLSEKIDEIIAEKIIERLITSGWLEVRIEGPFGGQEVLCLTPATEQGLRKSKQELLPSFQSQPKNKTLRAIMNTASSARRGVITSVEWNQYAQKITRNPRAKFLIQLKNEKIKTSIIS